MKNQLNISKVSVVFLPGGTAHVTLCVDRPTQWGDLPDCQGLPLNVKFEMPKFGVLKYVADHFDGVPCEVIHVP